MMIQAALPSPIGMIVVDCDEYHVVAVRILPPATIAGDPHARASGVAGVAIEQLHAYFQGALTQFDLPLKPLASPRGEALRQAICAIPFGQALSYGTVARSVDSGPRAIGQACRRNPLPIIVPCHRVTASGGIGHYSGGQGIETKIWLLHHEGAEPILL